MNSHVLMSAPTAWPQGRDRHERLADVLHQDGLDVLLALTPENAEYLSGRTSYIATHWRVPGVLGVAAGLDGRCVLVDSDASVDRLNPSSLHTVTYTSWTESLDLRDAAGESIGERVRAARPGQITRPAQFDLDEIANAVVDAIRAVDANPRRIGCDLDHIDVGSFARLRARLPAVEFVDASGRFLDLRAIKDPDEIEHLRLAAELTEIGIVAATNKLQLGQRQMAVNAAYHIAIQETVASDIRFTAFRQAEGVATIGFATPSAGIVAAAETIRFDMQVDIAGYHSDIGRTYVHQPTNDQRTLHAALWHALREAREMVKPGVSFADVHAAGTSAMVDAGFPAFSRGHLGHSDGLTQHFEEAPFIAPDEMRPLVPGMVLSLELPFYVRGVGGFQLEQMVLVTPDGHEMMDDLPFDLEIDVA